MTRPLEILEACVYASDLDAAERFYAGVLGLEVVARMPGRHLFFRCGGRVFLVFRPEGTLAAGGEIPPHGAHGPGHVCFAIGADEVDEWRARLLDRGVVIERDHGWPGGGRSLYFRDPAGNSVELGTPSIWRIPEDEALGTST
jgi:catechol 2,3-dioxygenase-like lactoylglutathione lyase family enzyme